MLSTRQESPLRSTGLTVNDELKMVDQDVGRIPEKDVFSFYRCATDDYVEVLLIMDQENSLECSAADRRWEVPGETDGTNRSHFTAVELYYHGLKLWWLTNFYTQTLHNPSRDPVMRRSSVECRYCNFGSFAELLPCWAWPNELDLSDPTAACGRRTKFAVVVAVLTSVGKGACFAMDVVWVGCGLPLGSSAVRKAVRHFEIVHVRGMHGMSTKSGKINSPGSLPGGGFRTVSAIGEAAGLPIASHGE